MVGKTRFRKIPERKESGASVRSLARKITASRMGRAAKPIVAQAALPARNCRSVSQKIGQRSAMPIGSLSLLPSQPPLGDGTTFG
jgi:hypothetical protein